MPYDFQRRVLATALVAAPCSAVVAEKIIPIPPAGDEA